VKLYDGRSTATRVRKHTDLMREKWKDPTYVRSVSRGHAFGYLARLQPGDPDITVIKEMFAELKARDPEVAARLGACDRA